MKKRHLFLVDPLPNIAPLIRKSLTGLNDDKLNVIIQRQTESVEALLDEINSMVSSNQDIALLAPYNDSPNASFLKQYKTADNNANSADLLDYILGEFYAKNPHYRLPVIIPFVSIFSPERINSMLDGKRNIKYALACMSKHIIGSLDGNLDKSKVDAVFYRHLNMPIQGINFMKDVV